MGMNIVDRIDDRVKVNHVLISVSDKSGLETFVPALVRINPEVKIFSTGGTFGAIETILGDAAAKHLVQVSDYTGQPETQGGLVKTLDFKIYLGILTETYNDSHKEDLKRTAAVPIDMVVVNLYPFAQTVAKEGVRVEEARSNIDIGGPTMVRASAKNYLRVASVVNPSDYEEVVASLEATGGATDLALRYALSVKAFEHTATYDRHIADYLAAQKFDSVSGCYNAS
ncbi:MAG: hypothetical protein MI742_10720 [Desulfobacterales bacterium]|nr:hypothetical protein [Desulfobacterales bacterium]